MNTSVTEEDLVIKCEVNFNRTSRNPIDYKYGPRSVVIGYFNNDTWPDTAVANYDADNVAIYFGYGNGTFTSSVLYETGSDSAPCMVAVADFDNDGRTDIAVANFGINSISLLFGTENGSFVSRTPLSTASSRPIFVYASDLNNDTAVDIVTVNYGTHSISVFYGYGNGAFSEPDSYSTGYDSFPLAVVSGDFNNDHKIDLAIANYGTNTVWILFGTGIGTFVNQAVLSTNLNSHPYSIAVGHLNDDNMLDIAVTNYGNKNVGVFLGHGNGTFLDQMTYLVDPSSPYAIGIGDFNKDSLMDIVVTSNDTDNIAVFLGYGNGTFAKPKPYSTESSSSISVAIGDLNKDNRLDIVVINNDTGSISILLGYDEGFPDQMTFSAGSWSIDVVIGDFNNDKQLDVIVTNSYDNTVSILLGYGNGSFANQITFSTGNSPWGAAIGDFNNDTILDIVFANSRNKSVSILLGYGNGSFASQMTFSTNTFPWGVAVGNFNKDITLDIFVTNSADNNVSVLLGYGNGSFAYQGTYSKGSSPQGLGVVDFNNDSRMDIVVANFNNETVSVLLRKDRGALNITNTFAAATGSLLRSFFVVDVNNDTLLDIIVCNYGTDNINVLIGLGKGTFGSKITYPVGLETHPGSITVDDLNKDGQMDIIVANYETKNLVTFLGSGNENFENLGTYSARFDFAPSIIAVGNFNNDGRLEILICGYYIIKFAVSFSSLTMLSC
ncbi:unnamed protein product [Rotaria socialis]|uniref:VCBS repeat-containing protein n=1 Tax=Rotaria socialis TaxID=392032 RepID=A0A817Y3F1_9BILA|nr:unnamed protein product [Rotaria socialis]